MRRALIAEDDEAQRRALARALEAELGPAAYGSAAGTILEVESVGTGREAFLAVWDRPPDVLIADVEMFSVADLGLLIRAAREQRRPRSAYALIVSGLPDNELASVAWSVSPNDWLSKPFSVPAIVARVRGGISWLDSVDAAISLGR